MSNDPLPLPDILAGPPDDAGDADYAAVYTEVMATERGRRFLIEYVSRNRPADTSTLAATLTRVEAAMRGDPPQDPAALARDFAALAAAIGRLEGERAPNALEAAVQEMGDAFYRNDAAGERAQGGAALLRDLAGRVNAMIAGAVDAGAEPEAIEDALVAAAAAQPEAAIDDKALEDEAAEDDASAHGRPLPSQPSEAEAQQDEVFAQAAGTLAASFPAPAEAGDPEDEPASELAADISSPRQQQEPEPAFGKAIDVSPYEAGANAVIAGQPKLIEAVAEPALVESSSIEPFASEPAESEQIEPAAAAGDRAAEPVAYYRATVFDVEDAGDAAVQVAAAPVIDIAPPTEGETEVLPTAETAAGEVDAPHRESVEDAASFTDPANIAHAGEGKSTEALSEQAVFREELPTTDIGSEELPNKDSSSEELPRAELPSEELENTELAIAQPTSEELQSRGAAGEEPSEERAIPAQQIFAPELTAPADQAPQPHAEPAEPAASIADQPASDELLGDVSAESRQAQPPPDAANEAVAGAVDTQSPDPDDIALRHEAQPAHQLPPDTQPLLGPEDDPADLFEPLPPATPSPIVTPQVAATPAVAPAPTTDVAANAEDREPPHDQGAGGADLGQADADILAAFSRDREQGRDEDVQTVMRVTEGEAAKEVLVAQPHTPFSAPKSALASATPTAVPTSSQPRANLAAAARPAARPSASDPLAALRALSEEELIALFS